MDFRKIGINILRLLLAFVFIFSGFVKAVDPWGTAIKLGEYFHAFGMDWLDWSKYIVSVILSAGEMLLGFALLFRLKEKLASLLVMIVMIFFTILTLILAIWEPVADCGCFGDAIKLTNWQTFYKNLVLLPCSIVLWMGVRHGYVASKVHPMVEGSMIVMFSLFTVGIGVYALRHLPVIDFLPFKEGIHIPSVINPENTGTTDAILIYRDKNSGEEHEFTLDDTEWQDTLRWEFVDTRIIEHDNVKKNVAEFSIFTSQENLTSAILNNQREQFIITLTDPALLSDKCRKNLLNLVTYAHAHDYSVMCVTPVQFDSDGLALSEDVKIPVYNMDATAQKSFIRAHEGVVLLNEGVIMAKWNCRDIPDFMSDSNTVILSQLLGKERQKSECRIIFTMLIVCALVYAGYFSYRRIYS